MADELDDLIRRAMKTLDSQVPSGYFEALPKQTLARLEGSMQTTGSTESEQASGVPPVNEDSGLHDIRNLAQSTKQRLSSKRISTSPVATDEEIIAASSAGWKAAVALPEPAKMISLPSIDELPSKQEVRAKDKAAAAAAPAVEVRQPFSQFARPAAPKKSKGVLAIVGVMAAAAAGVGIYFYTQNQGSPSASKTDTVVAAQAPAPVQTAAPAPAPAPTPPAGGVQVQPIEQPAPAQAADPAKEEAADADKVEAPPGKALTPPKQHALTKGGKSKAEPKDVQKVEKVETTKPTPTPPPPDTKTGKKTAGKGDENEPNFDDLLKEAGVDQNKKVVKPTLAKKELSSDDFKKGMAAIAAKAQGCYKGTQGTATFKVNVAPTGRISKVTITGMFAGKPEGECVQGAVLGATFPAWDGPPQSFTYSYLLAE